MAGMSWLKRRRIPIVVAGMLLALVAGSLTTSAQAAPRAAAEVAPIDCPTAVPLSTVTTGMIGEGFTVVTGSTPQPFKVDVLGVLTDGIGAGRDMILIKVSDLPGRHVIDQGGGIWAGMSGSPVYVDGQLLGAVSYGFTLAPSTIGGLTPAASMLDLLSLPGAQAAKAERALHQRTTVKLSASSRRDLAAKAHVATPRGTLSQLVTPLAVSGLGTKRIGRFQADADGAGLSVKAYAAGRAAAPSVTPAARPHAGGNFAAALSYGDFTIAGIGTTTAVCGNQAIAFGHPMNLSGPAAYGASDADSLAIIQDNTFGSFKMANVGADFGTVDQDRIAGIRADLRAAPTTADVTAIIRNLDTGKLRAGTTRVADQASLPGLLPYAVFAAQDAVFDEWGDGTATSDWTITGERAGGIPFSVSRSNQWASRGDVTIDPAFDIAIAADSLLNNDFEKVTIDSITFGSSMATTFEQLHITKMRVSVNGGKYSAAKSLSVKAGAKLKIRISMRPYRSTTTSTSTLKLTVPKSAKGKSGSLSAFGGASLSDQDGAEFDSDCLLEGDGCGDDEEVEGSLNAVIKGITSVPRNDALVAELALDSEDSNSPAPAVSVTKLRKLTITGGRSIVLRVRR
jgi:SpoIVB peptidase S55